VRARSFHVLGAAWLTAALLVGPVRAQEFTHETHRKEGVTDCTVCHEPDALTIVPPKKTCLDCHEQAELETYTFGKLKTHGPFWATEHERDAEASNANCSSCHEQKFCLDCHKGDPKHQRPDMHVADYLEIHPIKAWGNEDACRKCHEVSFCTDCHRRFRGEDLKVLSHRRGWSDKPVGSAGRRHAEQFQADPDSCRQCHPGGILSSHQWTSDHQREARRSLTTCQSCHPRGTVCLRCHSATRGLRASPHPKNWNSNHERLARASDERTCEKCHEPKGRDPVCQRCH